MPNKLADFFGMVFNNALFSRASLIKAAQGNGTLCDKIDKECGYPTSLDIADYKYMFDRFGIATRVVSGYPDECWTMDPSIFETQDQKVDTDFELAWEKLNVEMNLVHYMYRADLLSGIGAFGCLLLGLADGRDLREPAKGIDEFGRPEERKGLISQNELLFLRCFDQSMVTVAEWETNLKSPRYGFPKVYNIKFVDYTLESSGGAGQDGTEKPVHWTRVIHYADNRLSSETFGVPRLRPCWNYLHNMRKLLGGSAEMFWKGGFPGYSFEVLPELLGDIEFGDVEKEKLKTEFALYQEGLQRFLALQGITAKPLTPQVASPKDHVYAQLSAIAITTGFPIRVLLGTEESKLASTQDSRTWNKRLTRRNTKYTTPWVIRPTINRLQLLGTLPATKEPFLVDWPDLNNPTDADKAQVAAVWTEALMKYVKNGIFKMVPPLEFLTIVLEIPSIKAQAIIEAMAKYSPEKNMRDLFEMMKPSNAGRPGQNNRVKSDLNGSRSGSTH